MQLDGIGGGWYLTIIMDTELFKVVFSGRGLYDEFGILSCIICISKSGLNDHSVLTLFDILIQQA